MNEELEREEKEGLEGLPGREREEGGIGKSLERMGVMVVGKGVIAKCDKRKCPMMNRIQRGIKEERSGKGKMTKGGMEGVMLKAKTQ